MKVFQFIKKFIRYYNRYNNYYQIPKNSAAICFYILISLISILTLTFQIITLSDNILETFLLPKVINIFSENFSETLMAALPHLSLSGFSVVVLFNFFWGASKTINAYNRMADFIYLQVKNRSGLMNRISAFFMFMMLLLVILFEISLIIFSNLFITTYIPVRFKFLVRILQFILELFIIFTTILLLFMYAPPVKMRVKDAYKGALFSTFLIYLLLGIFVIIINLMNRFGSGYTIITVIAFSFLVLYYANYIIISGLILNYHGNFFQLKKALFRKD
ncbi:MAG TPA: YihY/virulence factor BrkB family protein [Acholeplasmataceae bacterium]|nr:YihY/virulence factor BrkB family protein [Acholeplasmataceae bacterium]